MKKIFHRWHKEDGTKVPLRETWHSDLLFWLDQTEWLWDKGILKYGNLFYRWTFGPGKSYTLFTYIEDFHKLCKRVYDLERGENNLLSALEQEVIILKAKEEYPLITVLGDSELEKIREHIESIHWGTEFTLEKLLEIVERYLQEREIEILKARKETRNEQKTTI